MYEYRKNEFEDTYDTDRGEFDTTRNNLRLQGQEARHEFNKRSVAQYLQNAANDPNDRTYQETLRRFSTMRPADVPRILRVPEEEEFDEDEELDEAVA